jgi:8-oxo-dGTP diphosphatase
MRERPDPSHRTAPRAIPFSVDVVIVTPRQRQLAVLAVRAPSARGRESWELPWAASRTGEALVAVARRAVRHVGLDEPAWIEQVGAFNELQHPSGAALSVCFVATVAVESERSAGSAAWMEAGTVPPFTGRQRGMTAAALRVLRQRMDYTPIPFRLLPPLFTLSDLQRVYEVLLGRRLHKASFRRALHAAWLVEPSNEWWSEGRGRPAQLFRFAPRKRRGHRRAVRFDLL